MSMLRSCCCSKKSKFTCLGCSTKTPIPVTWDVEFPTAVTSPGTIVVSASNLAANQPGAPDPPVGFHDEYTTTTTTLSEVAAFSGIVNVPVGTNPDMEGCPGCIWNKITDPWKRIWSVGEQYSRTVHDPPFDPVPVPAVTEFDSRNYDFVDGQCYRTIDTTPPSGWEAAPVRGFSDVGSSIGITVINQIATVSLRVRATAVVGYSRLTYVDYSGTPQLMVISAKPEQAAGVLVHWTGEFDCSEVKDSEWIEVTIDPDDATAAAAISFGVPNTLMIRANH